MSKHFVRFVKRISKSALILPVFFLLIGTAQAQPDGKALFDAVCKACHSVSDDVVIGPGLKDVHLRHKEDWLIKWIRNSSAMVKAGDAKAVELFEKYNKVAMPAYNGTDEDIKAILAYVKEEGEKAPVVAAVSGPAAQAESKETPKWLLWVIVAILGILASSLGKVKKSLEKAVRQKEGLPALPELKGWPAAKVWIRGNKKLIAVIFLVCFVWGSYKGWYALADIGIQQGYSPEQPIRFSHKIHAGQNGIDCQYCHYGASKSRHANIPSLNICMNCHKYVKEGPTYGKDEISKIYAALDYDPATQLYGDNPKPVRWIRVHNLPDLAYFNHAQHVVAGKVECQTCHGKVEEMEVLEQHAPLTMGWCIDCHRTTEVDVANNGYYEKFHGELAKMYGKDAKITVDKIGGLECAKCHY
ncbi:MAG TPA: c-type cytochrome [Bacteroidia bacterium]|nr:c-type cytochrome [Bacteroidia bacterium]HNT79318.1 c-type cytochrome [Bacteroidia bacterium]